MGSGEIKIIILFFLTGLTMTVQSERNYTDTTRSRNLHFINYDIEHGLSHNTVLCIEQDHQGFLWFGTLEGLNRFDGYDFKKYYHSSNNSNSLPGNNINKILEDSEKNLWIATSSGLAVYNRERDNFISFSEKTGLTLSNTIVTTILEDRKGGFWIGTFNGGLNYFSKEDSTLKIYNNEKDNKTITHHIIRTVFEDSNGTIWVGTRYGLNRYDPATDSFKHFVFDTEDIFGGNDIRSIYEFVNGTLWLGTNGGGIIRMNTNDLSFSIDEGNSKELGKLSSNTVKSMIKDRTGTKWIGSLNGLFLQEPGSYALHHYQHNPNDMGSLSAHSVRDILEDRDGNIWIAMYYGGISFYSPMNSRFINYTEKGPEQNGLSSNIVSAIEEDMSGNLWIGTEGGGLNHFNRLTGEFLHIKHKPGEKGLSSNFIKSLTIDQNGILWIGTIETGLDRYDPVRQIFINYQHDPDNPNTLSDNYIRSILIDSKNRMWLGTNGGGLNLFDRKTGTVKRIKEDLVKEPLVGLNINAMAETDEGLLVLGTNKGINLFDADKMENTFFAKYDTSEEAYLTEIWGLLVDNNDIWIGTNEAGLFKMDLENCHFTQFSTDNWLPNKVVYGILKDEHENLWVSTNKAITKINLSDSIAIHYDSHSGLLSNQFNYNSFYKTEKGEMVFGGNRGFTIFSPGEIEINNTPAPARITGFKLMNRPVELSDPESPLKSNIIVADQVTLSHKQSIFSIEFAALCYVAPEKNQYAYTLEGFLNEWIYLDNTRNVTFTNLDPGKYTFRLRVSNNDGLWNDDEAALNITVLPPWWRTNWAYFIYLLIITGSVILLFRLSQIRIDEKNKLKYERLEKQRIIELNQMKLKFFTNISHEFKTPLSLIIGPLEELKERFSSSQIDPDSAMKLSTAHKNSLMLNNLVEQLMAFRKIEAGALKLNVREVEMVAYLRKINESFLEMADRKNIRFTFSHDLSPVILWFDPEMIERVFFNILSNAFKFTPVGGTIEVIVDKKNDVDPVSIFISDSGPGIPESEFDRIFERFYQINDQHSTTGQGTGIGLSFAREIIHLHQGEITVSNIPEKGARFAIKLLPGFEHLKAHHITEEQYFPDTEIKKQVTDEPSGIIPKPSVLNDAPKGRRFTILIVEDNESLNEYLSTTLLNEFNTISATDGSQGLAITQKQHPDLIITDVMMPEINGIEMTNKIKSDFDTCHIPVIMLTAKSSVEDQIKGVMHGADAYIAKPFSMRLLRTQINSLIKNRDILRKAYGTQFQLEPSEVKIQSMDDKFLSKAMKIVEENIDKDTFNVQELGKEIGMSRMQLNRKLKGLLNQSPSEFIRTIRLKRAAQLMIDGNLNVSEVIFHVGINSRTYFTKAFTEQFGVPPKEYIRQIKASS